MPLGDHSFAPKVQTTVSPNMSPMGEALFLGTRVFLRWLGLFGRLLGLLTRFLGILRLLVFALVGFGNILLPSAFRAVAFCRAITRLTMYSPLSHCCLSLSLTLSHDQSDC